MVRLITLLMANRPTHSEPASSESPAVPLTIEGYSVLHQMMRFRWADWRSLRAASKTEIVHEAVGVIGKMEQGAAGQSAMYSLSVTRAT